MSIPHILGSEMKSRQLDEEPRASNREARDWSVLDTVEIETDKAVKISVKVQCPAEALFTPRLCRSITSKRGGCITYKQASEESGITR